jgi:hypothetical protein
MLSVYGDESSDQRQDRFFAVGGIIGNDQQWDALKSKWVERTGGIPFHANHCDSNYGVYRDIPNGENKALYKDLTILLAGSGLRGWGFVIDLPAQKQVFPNASDLAYYRCFVEVLDKMRQLAALLNDTVKFTFDSRKSDYNAGMLYGMFREGPDWQETMFNEISFTSSRDNPKVQVADLFTREIGKAFDNEHGPVKRPFRKSWMRYRKPETFLRTPPVQNSLRA